MTEARNNRIEIDDFDSNVIAQLVRYLQTSKIDESLEASAHDLLLIADKYDVRGLKVVAQSQAASEINVETVCATLNVATEIADTEDLRAACYDFMSANRAAVKAHESWKTLSDNAKEYLLSFF